MHGRSGVGWWWWFAVFGGCVVSSCSACLHGDVDVLEREEGEGGLILKRLASESVLCRVLFELTIWTPPRLSECAL